RAPVLPAYSGPQSAACAFGSTMNCSLCCRSENSIMDGKMDLAKFLSIVPRGDLWVFGYGSLMWSPDFPHAERKAGRVHGYHRSLCVLSSRYRGTPDKPGLVMGLCPGGSCR